MVKFNFIFLNGYVFLEPPINIMELLALRLGRMYL